MIDNVKIFNVSIVQRIFAGEPTHRRLDQTRADAVINRDQRGVLVQLRFRLLIELRALRVISSVERLRHQRIKCGAVIKRGVDGGATQHQIQERAGFVVIPAPGGTRHVVLPLMAALQRSFPFLVAQRDLRTEILFPHRRGRDRLTLVLF